MFKIRLTRFIDADIINIFRATGVVQIFESTGIFGTRFYCKYTNVFFPSVLTI